MPNDPIVAVTRVSGKGLALIPREIRERLDLKPGKRLIMVASKDAVVLQRDEVPVAKEGSMNIIQRIQSIFSMVPIRNIEK